MEEWKDGRVEGWKSGRMEEWKDGRGKGKDGRTFVYFVRISDNRARYIDTHGLPGLLAWKFKVLCGG